MTVFETIPQSYPLWTLIVRDNELEPALIIAWRIRAGEEATPIVAGHGDRPTSYEWPLNGGLFLSEAEARIEKDKVESEAYR